MDALRIIGGIGLLILLWLFFRGDRLLKKKAELVAAIQGLDDTMVLLGDIVYHGGFPPMPKPSRLQIGITDSYILLYNLAGETGRIEYQHIKKIDKFTAKLEKARRRKSILAWGTLAITSDTATYRNFITLNYLDVNGEENNLVLETKDDQEMNNHYEAIWQRYRRNIAHLESGAEASVS